ncbi:MAG: C45 family autoproteolytic acyltransferase/hydrolase [Gaiellales bacterium]
MTDSVLHHVSTEATPGQRGRAFGAAQQERIEKVAGVYGRLFSSMAGLEEADVRELGEQALEQVGGWAPDLLEEMEGIAEGSGVDLPVIGALNARTELLAASAGAGECSMVAVLGSATRDGRPLSVQTWDWHEELADCWLVWEILHADGRRVRTLTEAGIVGKIGVSGAGVGVHLNILGHQHDGPPVGVPVHVACRRVLDEADGAVSALELLSNAAVSASSAVTVVADDAEGGAACTIELSPAGPGFVTPDTRGVLVHTNHFLADPGRAADRMLRESPDTVLRFDHAQRRMSRLAEGEIDLASVLEAMTSHRGGPGAICCHPAPGAPFGERWTTLATIMLEPAAAEMRVLRGGPCAYAPSAAVATATA